jgi:hypothetical protein
LKPTFSTARPTLQLSRKLLGFMYIYELPSQLKSTAWLALLPFATL